MIVSSGPRVGFVETPVFGLVVVHVTVAVVFGGFGLVVPALDVAHHVHEIGIGVHLEFVQHVAQLFQDCQIAAAVHECDSGA